MNQIPGLGAVRRAHDTPALHLFHQPGRPVVADFQAALEVGGRSLPGAHHDFQRLFVHRIVPAGGFQLELIVVFLIEEHLIIDVLRLAQALHMLRHALHLFFSQKSALHP